MSSGCAGPPLPTAPVLCHGPALWSPPSQSDGDSPMHALLQLTSQSPPLAGISVFLQSHLQSPSRLPNVDLATAAAGNTIYHIGLLDDYLIPLFIQAVLVFLFLFLTYAFLLLFGQWLQAISHLRLFSWVNCSQGIMDPYNAPYKPKHHYCPGLLLVFHFVLLVFTFKFNPRAMPPALTYYQF